MAWRLEIRVSPKIWKFFWNFVPNSGFKNFSTARQSSQRVVNLARRRLDVLCSKLATVVGQTELTICATVDVGPTSLTMHFVTLSVHLVDQHDTRERVHL